jgi:hypothetical protein
MRKWSLTTFACGMQEAKLKEKINSRYCSMENMFALNDLSLLKTSHSYSIYPYAPFALLYNL